MSCQLEVLHHILPQSIRRTLNELPESLDETYERVLKEIRLANRDHSHRLLQCLTVAMRPLRVEELAEILALDFDGAGGAIPEFKEAWRWDDRQHAVLSMCSSLITFIDDGDSCVVQFSHFSVKKFLTSDRLAASPRDISTFHIMLEAAHTTLAQACLGILLELDGSSNNSQVEGRFLLGRYASRHWVEHAQFGQVSSRIEDAIRHLFDSTQPYFSAWLRLHDIDEPWDNFGTYETTDRGSPLYYASLCGFRDLAAHIIAVHPEQVNTRGGCNYSPLVAALHKRHFDVAELLCQHGATVDVIGFMNRTALQAASAQGLLDVERWLLDHGADAHLQADYPSIPSTTNGHLGAVQAQQDDSLRFNFANHAGFVPLDTATENLKGEAGMLASHGNDNPSHVPSEITASPLIPDYVDRPLTPPSHTSLPPTPLPTDARSFGVREISPVRDAPSKAAQVQPIISTPRAAPQPTTAASARIPAVSFGSFAASAPSAPALLPLASLTPSRSRSPATFSARVGGHRPDGDGALTPASTWWNNSKRRHMIPIEQAEGYSHTRSVRPFLSASFTETYTL